MVFLWLKSTYLGQVKKSLASILTVLISLSCEKDIVYEFEHTSFSTTNFELCDYDSCPNISLDYIAFKTPETLTTIVNKDIENYLNDRLLFKNQTAVSIKEAVAIYLSNAQNSYPETSEFSEAHTFDMDMTVAYTSNDIVSLQATYYEFAGGAHGTNGVHFWNYNPKTGQKLKNENLFKDEKAFNAFAKARFIQTHGPLHLFKFKDGRYELPQNIGFNQDGIRLFYNRYEIAAYAEGTLELNFSWQEVEDYLNL